MSIAIQFERNIVETFYRNQRFYMVSICSKAADKYIRDLSAIREYSNIVCMCMSVLYGKAVYNHGFIEFGGGFMQPDMYIPRITNYEKVLYSIL